eukprot:1161077-Pelagomonas_calceolata.AAC.3
MGKHGKSDKKHKKHHHKKRKRHDSSSSSSSSESGGDSDMERKRQKSEKYVRHPLCAQHTSHGKCLLLARVSIGVQAAHQKHAPSKNRSARGGSLAEGCRRQRRVCVGQEGGEGAERGQKVEGNQCIPRQAKGPGAAGECLSNKMPGLLH